MQYIEAPSMDMISNRSLFLAGTITGAADWQTKMADALRDLEITVVNPRRASEIGNQGEEAKKQIAWEFERLKQVDVISFYFSNETVGPITLFELGRHTYPSSIKKNQKPVFVCVHPEYQRKFDIEVQMGLVGITPVYSLEQLIKDVRKHFIDSFSKKKCERCGGSGSREHSDDGDCPQCDGKGWNYDETFLKKVVDA